MKKPRKTSRKETGIVFSSLYFIAQRLITSLISVEYIQHKVGLFARFDQFSIRLNNI